MTSLLAIAVLACVSAEPHFTQIPAEDAFAIDGTWEWTYVESVDRRVSYAGERSVRLEKGRGYQTPSGTARLRRIEQVGPRGYRAECWHKVDGWIQCSMRIESDETLVVRLSSAKLEWHLKPYGLDNRPWLVAELAANRILSAESVAARSAVLQTPAGSDAPRTDAATSMETDFGRYFAIAIGNERYAALPDLATPAADARAVADTLRDRYGYETRLLLDSTRDEIISTVASYRRMLGPRDNLLVYYAGHGWFDDEADQGYWLPVDADLSDPSRWISNSTIADLLRANPAKHALVVADSCFSGTLTRGISVAPPSEGWHRRLAGKKARTALTSGGLEPVEDGGGSGHSAFALAFLTALRNNTGILDGHGLYTNIRRQVMLRADQTPEYGDIRRAGHDGGDFLFIPEVNR